VPDRIPQLQVAGELQARLCRENGSPTYEAMINALVARLADPGAATELLRADSGDPIRSAVYLRLLSAVHRVALTDPSCPLRAFYPSTGGSVDVRRVVPVFLDVVEDNPETIAAGMQAHIQTNEVGRAAPLSAAMCYVAASSGTPLRLLEVGASAGLNLWLDRYRVHAGDMAWGPPDSPLQLVGHFASGTPPPVGFAVIDRRGCDLNPIDIGDPRARWLLRSFVWPEHVERLERLDAALSAASPAPLDALDACSWLRSRLVELTAGATTVIFHSLLLPYLADDERLKFERLIRRAGEQADHARRLAWVSLEPTPEYDDVLLICELWPERRRVRLATSTPHGTEIRWDPVPLPSPEAVGEQR
jgi:hypothetical protein